MLHIQYMQCDNHRIWVIRGNFFIYIDGGISLRAMENRIHRMFDGDTPAIKEIEMGYGGVSGHYTITCAKETTSNMLVEILKKFELMDIKLTSKEYCHAENEMYESYDGHPSGKRLRWNGDHIEPIIIPWVS